MSKPDSTPEKPLLKWPGGKRSIAPVIAEYLPFCQGKYFEPFAGGAALYFHTRPQRAILADVNQDLMECYQEVRDNPDMVAVHLGSMRNSADVYYQIRAELPNAPARRAARTIYLSMLSFNGIYRLNQKGEFNVPYGQKTHLAMPDAEALSHYSSLLQNAEIRTGDFEKTTQDACEGDVIYFDPPYTVAHNNNGFVKYNATIFSWDDQRRLASYASQLAKRGCKVLVSNAFHPSLTSLYCGFGLVCIDRSSVIAASSSHRKMVSESLFYI